MGNRGLKEYIKKLNIQLKDFVQLVCGELTKLQRKTIGPLVVIDVHARDVTHDMGEQDVSSTDDFEWMAQLHYCMVDQRRPGLRLRVSGQLGPPGHHPAHRPLLPHADGRAQAQLPRCARGTR